MNVLDSLKDRKIVVFGAGSIGERHISVLQKLGYTNIIVYRKRNLPLRNIDPQSIQIVTSLEQIIAAKPFAAIICSPTSEHTSQTLFCLEHNIHVLIEKPVSSNYDELSSFINHANINGTYLQAGYMLRYHHFFEKIKNLIDNKTYGKLLSIDAYWGEYLPDWHPWEDYKESYAAKKSLGGGAALTLSHDLDLILWLNNFELEKHFSLKNTSSNLDVDVDSGFDILLKFKNGVTAHSHNNFHQKKPLREYKFVFDNAFIKINYFDSVMEIFHDHVHTIERIEAFDRNSMFEKQWLAFISDCREAIQSNNFGKSMQNINNSFNIIKLTTDEQ
ncbi:Gfo/Idh/MocA family protein [Polluticaenibacter yanchengensis]|uniref:Gfo/Idh/MocA family oxidoreductase n=1 Tax=Polluticaenibacter yanchengensis TaxID=3014562 RepID=A0ABT4UMG1_9BACT|nr:Gfo/Idh/MocA family oxidoreductase [Chitinophagaceae bacterium LY-5]